MQALELWVLGVIFELGADNVDLNMFALVGQAASRGMGLLYLLLILALVLFETC